MSITLGLKRIKYQLMHLYYVNKVHKEVYGKHNSALFFHDIDKVKYIIFRPSLSKEKIKAIHRNRKPHHITHAVMHQSKVKRIHIVEMLCDWESARFSKPDKPLSAREYYNDHYASSDLPEKIKTLIETELNNFNYL